MTTERPESSDSTTPAPPFSDAATPFSGFTDPGPSSPDTAPLPTGAAPEPETQAPVAAPVGPPLFSPTPAPFEASPIDPLVHDAYAAPVGMTDTYLTEPLPTNDPWAPPSAASASGPATFPWAQNVNAGAAPEAKSSRRSPRSLVAVVAATALMAGAAGGVIGTQFGSDSSSTTSASSFTAPTDTGRSATVSLPDGSVAKVADTVLPSVVSIEVRSSRGGGSGSGVIIDPVGLILTNNHVIEQAVDNGALRVTLNDGRTAEATIVGRDAGSDLAVIKVEGLSNLAAIQIGSSGSLSVGETVVAIGSPLGLSGTVTSGIVSALNRPVQTGASDGPGADSELATLNAIQTDAAINPGNSGGPLVDLAGRLVGINSAIANLSRGSGQAGSIGLGFAIPIDQAAKVADQLIKTGKAEHGRLGVTAENATTPALGAALVQVSPDSPASAAGLTVGDVVTGFAQQRIDGADSLVAAVRSSQPGDKVELTYSRGGTSKTVTVTLGSDAP